MNRVVKSSLRPVRNLALTLTLNIFVCSVLFELLEDDDHGPIGSVYWAVTTASTTGYGDLSPAGWAGRLVAMWLMISSVVIVAVATGQIAGAVANDPHLFSDEEQAEMKDDNKDQLLMECLVMQHLGISIPDCVEEWHSEWKHKYGNAVTLNKEGSANG